MNAVTIVKQALLQSGTSWVLWLLAALSLASIAVAVERWLFYRARECDLPAVARNLGEHLATRELAAARRALATSTSVAAVIAAAGLELAHLGPDAADKAMQSAAALQRKRLEGRLAYLGTLGNNAPFIGLFGTVAGIIKAFDAMGQADGQVGIAQTASQTVMASIAEALVATAVGILVALPAVVAFNYFQRRMAALLADTEVLSNLVLAHLSANPERTRDGVSPSPR